MQGFRRVEELLSDRTIGSIQAAGGDGERAGKDCEGEGHATNYGLVLAAKRRVGIGGFLCWALTLEKPKLGVGIGGISSS
mmetsp:Transcript_50262/g.107367  ORF Transcript_50262/g.107367 Transcript_50262/m.107367 type:complete len:80 (-) Transcript_50262:103-342(-)